MNDSFFEERRNKFNTLLDEAAAIHSEVEAEKKRREAERNAGLENRLKQLPKARLDAVTAITILSEYGVISENADKEVLENAMQDIADQFERNHAEAAPKPPVHKTVPTEERLALYIIGKLAVEAVLTHEIIHDTEKDLNWLMGDIADAIREAMPSLDMVEMDRLAGRTHVRRDI